MDEQAVKSNPMYVISTYDGTMTVKFLGMMRMEDHLAFQKEYKEIVNAMYYRKKLILDCVKMKVTPRDVAIELDKILAMYTKDFAKIKIIVPKEKDNSILVSQIHRLCKESNIKYEEQTI